MRSNKKIDCFYVVFFPEFKKTFNVALAFTNYFTFLTSAWKNLFKLDLKSKILSLRVLIWMVMSSMSIKVPIYKVWTGFDVFFKKKSCCRCLLLCAQQHSLPRTQQHNNYKKNTRFVRILYLKGLYSASSSIRSLENCLKKLVFTTF